MGRKMSPHGGPVANEFMILCGGGCRKVGNSGIDPPDGIRDICTVNRNFIADEEVLFDIFLYPFTKLNLLLNCPVAVSHFP
jgi:hypothetical protein